MSNSVSLGQHEEILEVAEKIVASIDEIGGPRNFERYCACELFVRLYNPMGSDATTKDTAKRCVRAAILFHEEYLTASRIFAKTGELPCKETETRLS